ncbi:MAG: biopolymer transporter ExbD [Hyphococcus sp.]|nr:MAG: biopolymer transporter ExbD [Marinicaulis sp.]
MRKRATHAGEEADVNITPLLDIVFILLIFFIVTATFLREKGIDVSTPDNSEDPPEVPAPALVLAVQEDGFVRVNGLRVIDPGSVKPVVQEFMAREPNGSVLVSAAPESDSGIAVRVMDQAKDGGAGNVALTLQKEQS